MNRSRFNANRNAACPRSFPRKYGGQYGRGRVEPLYPFAPEAEPRERRPAWAIGPEIDVEFAWQACMVQLAQQTGVVAEEEWLTQPRVTYRIPGPYGLYRDVAGADRI